jgi:hypothetical protein
MITEETIAMAILNALSTEEKTKISIGNTTTIQVSISIQIPEKPKEKKPSFFSRFKKH